MIRFDRETRTFSLDHAGCAIPAWEFSLEADGRRLAARDARLTVLAETPLSFRLSFPEPALDWDLRIEEDPDGGRWTVASTLRNRSSAAVKLGRIRLLEAEAVRLGGAVPGAPGAASDAAVLSLSGLQWPRRIHRLGDAECPRESKIKAQFHCAGAGAALQVGFLTFGRADTVVAHGFDAGKGLHALEARCDYAGWELPAGAGTPVETFTVACGADPCAQLESWAERAAVTMKARRWEEAPLGWLGWAWADAFTVERYEDVVLRNAEAMRTRLGGFGLRYVWVSIGNLKDGIPGNWLDWNRESFPSGPEALVGWLREKGITLGFWCGATWVCAMAEDALRRMRDALLPAPDGKGPLVVHPGWPYGKAGLMKKEERPVIYALDPSHPKALAFLRETFETYRKWGIRYFMIDFQHASAGSVSNIPCGPHHDRTLVAGPEVYRRGMQAIREAAGDDTYLLGSTGPTVHNTGLVDAVRTGNDFGEGRALYPESYFYPATYVINSGAFWTGPQHALLNQATHWYTHRRLYLNDSGNVLTVDKPLPLADAQVHATIHAMSGGPTMLGDDLARIDGERLSLIKKTLPRPREVARPVNLFSCVHPAMPRVFHRKVVKPWGRHDVVALYNFSDELARESVALADLGLDPARRYLAFEFWNGEYQGRMSGALTATVPPRCVRVYRLTEDAGRPALMATDMHVLMGEMEILSCAWDAASMTLSGKAWRPRGERGSVFLHAPETVRVTTPLGVYIAKDARDKTLILRVPLDFSGTAGGDGSFRVSFALLPGVQELKTAHDEA